MSRTSWVQTEEGRWALALAWCWCVEQGLAPPLGDAQSAVAVDAELEAGVVRPLGLRHQQAWATIVGGLGSGRDWRRLVDFVGQGVRGIAKVLLADVVEAGMQRPPNWRSASVRKVAGGWEVVVGWGSTLQQAGTWPTEATAQLVAAQLRPATADRRRDE